MEHFLPDHFAVSSLCLTNITSTPIGIKIILSSLFSDHKLKMGVESLALIDQAEVNSLDHSKQGKLPLEKKFYIRGKVEKIWLCA